MEQHFLDKQEVIRLLLVSVAAGEHMLLVGPPGTAKSALVRTFAKLIDARYFEYLLTRFTEPNELFGPFDIRKLRDGTFVRVAGWVIVRQRPGTAKGFMFLSLEDETGVSNIIVTPQLFDKYRSELVGHPFLLIEGALQNQDNVISVKASHVQPLKFAVAAAPSHDFH